MGYNTFGILLLTIVLLYSAWIGFEIAYRNSLGFFVIITLSLLLAPILYFSSVKDAQNAKDAAQRAAIVGGLAFVIIMGFFEFLLIEGKIKYGFLYKRLLSLVPQGVVLSSAAAAITVALSSPCSL